MSTWRRAVRFGIETGGYLFHGRWEFAVGEVLIEIVRVVVVQVDSLHRVIVVVDLHESYHQDFS